VAEEVAAAAEAAERGGQSGALRIGADLTPQQRRAVLQTEALHGSPPGTVMIGGQRVRLVVRDPAQEDLDTETEAQAEGPAEAQEQPLRRSTRGRTQATLLGLVRRASLPPLLVLLQPEAHQLLVRGPSGFTEISLLCRPERSSSCDSFRFLLGFQLLGIHEPVPGSTQSSRRTSTRHWFALSLSSGSIESLTLRYWGTWLGQIFVNTSPTSTDSLSCLLYLILTVSSGSESSMLQCGFLRITVISTTHWQGLTTGSQHRGPERCLGCELTPPGFTSCATGTSSPQVVLMVVRYHRLTSWLPVSVRRLERAPAGQWET